jgi:hypothetical protein
MAKQRLTADTPDDIKASVAASREAVELLRKMRPASGITATTGGRNTRVSLAALIGDRGSHQAPLVYPPASATPRTSAGVPVQGWREAQEDATKTCA